MIPYNLEHVFFFFCAGGCCMLTLAPSNIGLAGQMPSKNGIIMCGSSRNTMNEDQTVTTLRAAVVLFSHPLQVES